MKERIISGSILLVALLLIVCFAPVWLFYLVTALAAVIACWEYTRLLYPANIDQAHATNPADKRNRLKLPGLLILYFMTAMPFLGMGVLLFAPQQQTAQQVVDQANSFLRYGFFAWFLSLILYRNTQRLYDHAYSFFLSVFAGLGLSGFFFSLFIIRFFSVDANPTAEQWLSYNPDKSSWMFWFVLLLVVLADSGAYFSGKFLGKNKMAPTISPNKTREGLYGGLAASLALAIVVSFTDSITGLQGHGASRSFAFVIICALTVLFSVHGDLAESFLKRRAQIKDSSHLIPGHGGILDRLDSLQPAFLMFTYLWMFNVASGYIRI